MEDINPDLAEAFNSYAQKHARVNFARSNGGQIPVQIATLSDISIVDDLSLEEDNAVSVPTKTDYHHIQKIPKV